MIVARDRAHVRALFNQYPAHEIITAREFFDRLRLLAFSHHKTMVKNDHAPMLIASTLLRNHEKFSLHQLPALTALYTACYHGMLPPEAVYQAIKEQPFSFNDVFCFLSKLDQKIQQQSFCTDVSALYYALNIMRYENKLPYSFAHVQEISLFHLVDLTLLEIEIIKAMSRLGMQFNVHFALDFNQRGINAAIDFIARQFERCEDLLNIDVIFEDIASDGPIKPLIQNLFADQVNLEFSSEQVSVNLCQNVLEEAYKIAQAVAHVHLQDPTQRIAVAVRSLDVRSVIYKKALERFSILAKDRKGTPFLESSAGRLISIFFAIKSTDISRSKIISLINSPVSIFYVSDEQKRLELSSIMSFLGIDDRVAQETDNFHHIYKNIDHAIALLGPENEKYNGLLLFKNWLFSLQDFLSVLPKQSFLADYIKAFYDFIAKVIIDNDPSAIALKDAANNFCKNVAKLPQTEILFEEFKILIMSLLSSITVNTPDCGDMHVVEFMPLPELLGRKFDHVFIADMSFGKLPKNLMADSLMSDQARTELNSFLKWPLLRVFMDDPFEPLTVPPRQALEPFWFASALAAAQKSTHFYCSARDEMGQEQAVGEFFLWLHQHIKTSNSEQERALINFEEKQFLTGLTAPYEDDFKQALLERKQAFLEQKPGPFAFLFNSDALVNCFDGKLDPLPTKAITPSLIEAFAQCRYKGLLQRIFSIETPDNDNDDIDARIIGQLGHSALEIFFKNSNNFAEHEIKSHLKKITQEVSDKYSIKNYVKNQDVLTCHMEWLTDALVQLCKVILFSDEYANSHIIACEKSYGLGKNTDYALPLSIHGRVYLLGGRIDRIDRNDRGFLITDYKLSSVENLKGLKKDILVNAFQMPIYVRLAARNIAGCNQEKLSFVYASMRDGQLVSLPYDEYRDLFEQIFDDQREKNLASRIDHIFSPLAKGEALATPGDHCSFCDFAYICRKS